MLCGVRKFVEGVVRSNGRLGPIDCKRGLLGGNDNGEVNLNRVGIRRQSWYAFLYTPSFEMIKLQFIFLPR